MPSQTANPIELLKSDHQQVSELFSRFEQTQDGSARKKIVSDALAALSVHAAIEEEIFYPAARQLIDDKQLIDEAIAEHAEAKEAMDSLAQDHDDATRDRQFRRLMDLVRHHVQEEENELFPKLAGKEAQLAELTPALQDRKQELSRVSLFL